MSETDIQTAVDDMLAELLKEGIADKGDYIDSDTELLMCGKCHTKKQTIVKLMGAHDETVMFVQMQGGGIGERETETETGGKGADRGHFKAEKRRASGQYFFWVYFCKL